MMSCQIIAPSVPDGVRQDKRFIVYIRAVPDGEWRQVETYAARVDMHDVRQAAVGIFDFAGRVEVRVRPAVSWIHSVFIRPLSLGLNPVSDGHEIRFTLSEPADMMLEINGERYHCLHLFAGEIQSAPMNTVLWLDAGQPGPHTTATRRLLSQLTGMPAGTTLAFGPGLHVIEEYLFPVLSGLNVYIAPGAVVIGGFVADGVENVRIYGHGVILQESFHRFSSINGVRISHSRHVIIEGVTFINPPHYTLYLGGSEDITIRGIRAFSCEGWSDGIDMMSCRKVHIDRCFLRNSDDCIAVYGRRWAYNGDTQDVLVENSILWADVAHPTNIGTHGDYEHDGNVLERITFRNIDILEHHEFQPDYLGCLAINAGDRNTVQDVLYEDIRVEQIAHGKLIDVQVKYNPDYNPAPGHCIRRVTFRNIHCGCMPPVASVIAGYDESRSVRDITLENVTVQGKPAEIEIGSWTENIVEISR